MSYAIHSRYSIVGRTHTVVKRHLATCPTCRHRGEFTYLGDQCWPPEIARKLGLPEIIVLWSCPCCQTTVSDPDLLPARMGSECQLSLVQPVPRPLRVPQLRLSRSK